MNRKTYYLLTDEDGRCFRASTLLAGTCWQYANDGLDVISQNIWECGATPVLAVMKNPLHSECASPRLFKITMREKYVGASLTRDLTVDENEMPDVSPEQKLAFAMYVVRQLAPEHAFSHWVERWLSRMDRSATGVRLAMKSLIETAEEVDISVIKLNHMGLRGAAKSDYHEAKYDFLWRAYEITEAAQVMIMKPERWRNIVAEKVATATGGALEETQLADLADLAMHIAAETNFVAYVSSPKKILRREREQSSPASYAVIEFSDTGLQIEQYDVVKEKRD
jgi:hypothetical protein